MAFGPFTGFSLSALVLGQRVFPTPESRARARLLAWLLVVWLPIPLVSLARINAETGSFSFLAAAGTALVPLLSIGMRLGVSTAWSGFLFGLCMEFLFIEGIASIGSVSQIVGLAFMPSLAVLASGRRFAIPLLAPPIAFSFGLYRLAPFFRNARFPSALLPEIGATPETANFLLLLFIIFAVTCGVEKIVLDVYSAMLGERASAEKEIMERKDKERILAAVFSAVPVPVFVKDRDYRYVACSDSFYEYLELPRERVLGQLSSEVFPESVSAPIIAADRRMTESDVVQSVSIRATRTNGKSAEATILKMQFRDESGAVAGSVGVVLDETERFARERQLEALLNSNRGALSLLGHDLRNPLGSFRDLVHSMEGDAEIDPTECREVLSELGKSLDALYRLLDELLDWAREEGDFHVVEPKSLPAAALVSKTLSLLALQAGSKGVELEARVPDGLSVYADERLLEPILRNLAGNAVKFTPRGGRVVVAASRSLRDRGVTFAVSDTGIGMSAAAVRSIFENGTAKHRPGTEGEPGTGLGLGLCRRLVDRHGGTMEIESVEGGGSTFTIFLPDPTPAALS